jgi:hypothetical protein
MVVSIVELAVAMGSFESESTLELGYQIGELDPKSKDPLKMWGYPLSFYLCRCYPSGDDNGSDAHFKINPVIIEHIIGRP